MFDSGEYRQSWVVIKIFCTMKQRVLFDDNVGDTCLDFGSAKFG